MDSRTCGGGKRARNRLSLADPNRNRPVASELSFGQDLIVESPAYSVAKAEGSR
jgi:hypothetical protein